jgi:hypothetical protein
MRAMSASSSTACSCTCLSADAFPIDDPMLVLTAVVARAELDLLTDLEQPDFDDDDEHEIDDDEELLDPPGWEHHRQR